jgi:hypothetical protein
MVSGEAYLGMGMVSGALMYLPRVVQHHLAISGASWSTAGRRSSLLPLKPVQTLLRGGVLCMACRQQELRLELNGPRRTWRPMDHTNTMRQAIHQRSLLDLLCPLYNRSLVTDETLAKTLKPSQSPAHHRRSEDNPSRRGNSSPPDARRTRRRGAIL